MDFIVIHTTCGCKAEVVRCESDCVVLVKCSLCDQEEYVVLDEEE